MHTGKCNMVEQGTPIMSKPPRDDDCLHCRLWPVIHKFCDDHPDEDNFLMALADVIGDQLASDGAMPHRHEFLDEINRRIERRIEIVRADKARTG